MNKQRRWRSAAIEGVVIVASILLAFWIDAWAESSEERRIEQHHFELLVRDLTQEIATLQDYISYTSARGAAADTLISLVRTDSAPRDSDLSGLLVRATQRRTVLPAQAAYKGLIASGDLALISDPILRDWIVRHYEVLERERAVITKNDAVYVDGLAVDAVFGMGLFDRDWSALDDVDRALVLGGLYGRRGTVEPNRGSAETMIRSATALRQELIQRIGSS